MHPVIISIKRPFVKITIARISRWPSNTHAVPPHSQVPTTLTSTPLSVAVQTCMHTNLMVPKKAPSRRNGLPQTARSTRTVLMHAHASHSMQYEHRHKHMHAGVGVVHACLCITAANQQHSHPALQTLPTCCPSIPTRHATAPGGLHHSHTALSYAPTTLKARTHTCATHPSAHQQTQALNQQTHPSLPLPSHNLHMHARMGPCTALLSAAGGAH